MKISPVSCGFCHAKSQPYLKAKDLNRHTTNEVFTYYRCSSCGLIFLSPVPPNLGIYYPTDYYHFPASLDEFAPLTEAQAYKITLVKQFVSEGRLLEIGPGPGDFAYLAKKGGFDVDVIEMDARCCDFLSGVIGVHALQGADTVGVLRTLGNYDVIALWHVIEHLSDPWRVLSAASEHLSPGGILLIAAPNPEAYQFSIFKQYWTHLDTPRHVTLIPSSAITQWLKEYGLTPVLATTTDDGSLGWNAFGWRFSLSNLMRRRLQMRTAGRILTSLFAPVERTGWRGCTYTLIFRKE